MALKLYAHRDRTGVAEARALLDTAYRWLDGAISGRQWAAGDAFSLADCAATRRRLLARPSFARAVDGARPYRPLFPLGAPDRD